MHILVYITTCDIYNKVALGIKILAEPAAMNTNIAEL